MRLGFRSPTLNMKEAIFSTILYPPNKATQCHNPENHNMTLHLCSNINFCTSTCYSMRFFIAIRAHCKTGIHIMAYVGVNIFPRCSILIFTKVKGWPLLWSFPIHILVQSIAPTLHCLSFEDPSQHFVLINYKQFYYTLVNNVTLTDVLLTKV